MKMMNKKFTPINYKIFLSLFLFLIVFILSGNAQDYKIVKAQKGDGVYSLLRRYGLPASNFDDFVDLNKGKLSKNNELIIGRSYKLPCKGNTSEPSNKKPAPVGGKTSVYKIFGKKYEKVTKVDSRLKGAVFYLQSGHGGPDPGAVGRLNGHMLCEDEYAYDVTLRLARNLIEHGATVYMITRDPNDGIRDNSFLKPDKDERCYPNKRIPARQISRLRQRKDAVNSLYMKNKGKYQRQIVVHVDSRSKKQNIDVFFIMTNEAIKGKNLQEIWLTHSTRNTENTNREEVITDQYLPGTCML